MHKRLSLISKFMQISWIVSESRGAVYFDKSGIRNLAIEIGRVHPHEIASNNARLTMNKRLLTPFTAIP